MIWSAKDFMQNLQGLSQRSRVWVYQAARPFTESEKEYILEMGEEFLAGWNTHGTNLVADLGLLFDQFIVFVSDEEQVKASGCSIDQSVGLIRKIAEETGVDMFDRKLVTYMQNGSIKTTGLDSLGTLVNMQVLGPETLVFNNLVDNLADLRDVWLIPIRRSWHNQFLDTNA